MKHLYEKLMEYDEKNIYPFHMPGHKRNRGLLPSCFPVSMDITEITGFDDLHHPEDLILRAEQEASDLFGSLKTYFVVNGSTAAILTSISASVRRGGRILIARNCHKSVYHAVYLRGLMPVYVYPSCLSDSAQTVSDSNISEISGGISPEAVEKAFGLNPDIEAVVITSPTYDGVVSDVKAIAEIAHRFGAVLIVDEAHGAHFCFSEYFPASAVTEGADLVIQSIHKTLPSLTQTAFLHRCSDRTDPGLLRRFLSIYQSSSPSYILMAGMDACIDLLKKNHESLFDNYTERLEKCRSRLSLFRNIRLVVPKTGESGDVFDFDRSRIILSPCFQRMSGTEFFRRLRDDYGIELEMAGLSYVLALSSVGDTEEGFDRLVDAVSETDAWLEKENQKRKPDYPGKLPALKQILLPSDAMERESFPCLLEKSTGKVSAEFVYVYPPGSPILVPGEVITEEVIQYIEICKSLEMNLQGMRDKEHRFIQVTDRF